MKERNTRHQAIRRLIKINRIGSQEELLELLRMEEYEITQATLSRDLKTLRVGKIYDGGTGYYYAIPSDEQIRETTKHYIQDLLRGWLSIRFSSNLGVVKTLAGHADSVAIALDNLDIPGLVGTLAGDDTIILVMGEGVSKDEFVAELLKKIPEIEESQWNDQ